MNARCVRCGNLYALDFADGYLPDACHACFSKLADLLDRDDCARAFAGAVDRYRRNTSRHPTIIAINAHFATIIDTGGVPF